MVKGLKGEEEMLQGRPLRITAELRWEMCLAEGKAGANALRLELVWGTASPIGKAYMAGVCKGREV